jgi:SSS family solute:Na+ symporter
MMGGLDYLIIGAFFTIVFAIGLYERGKLTLADYWVNSRRTSVWILIATTLSSFIGAASILGNGSVAFSGGGLATLAVPLSYFFHFLIFALFFAPKIKEFGDTHGGYTLPDYLSFKFSPRVGNLSALVILVTFALYLALQILAFGLFVAAFSGFEPNTATILAALITISYTAVGGIRADMRTDIFQFFIMMVLLFIFLPEIVAEASIAKMTSLPPEFLNGSQFAPGYVWLFALLFLGASVVASPDLWVRAYAGKDPSAVKKSMVLSSFMVLAFMSMAVILGIAGKVLLPTSSANSILPDLLVRFVPSGVFGLMMAGFFAAIMSSADTVLLVLSMTVVRDIYQKGINPGASEDSLLRLSRNLIIIFGLVGLGVALVIFNIAHLSIQAVSFYACLIPVIVFGFYGNNLSERAAFWSIALGFIAIIFGLFFDPVQAFIPGIAVSGITYFLIDKYLSK